MKLQILIPQYNETDEVVKPLLDSIAMQQNADDFGVIIVNDGSDTMLSYDLLSSYDYPIEYHLNPHKGLSATRQKAFDLADAEYVMWCDADDMFLSCIGIYTIYQMMPYEMLISNFAEETRVGDYPVYVNHPKDGIFVHGKVYNRQWILDNDIRWCDRLTIAEDSYYNGICLNVATDIKYCETPFYLWKWRNGSTIRSVTDMEILPDMLLSNKTLITEMIRRGMGDVADYYKEEMQKQLDIMRDLPEWGEIQEKEYIKWKS